ncbi:MAG: DUF1631 family protein [Pseudomonadota bacterium]
MSQGEQVFELSGSLGAQPVFLRVASTFMAFLTARIEAALDVAHGQLTELALDAPSDTERTAYMDAAIRVRRDRDGLRDGVLGAAGKTLREYAQLKLAQAEGDRAERLRAVSRELRVLDDDDVAETLACEAAVQRAEQRYQADLHCLSLRLAELAGIETLAPEQNPLGPQRLIEALRESLERLDCELCGRLEVIYVFDQALMRQLEALYDPINRILADAGVLPNIRWEPRIRRAQESQDPEEAFDEAGEASAAPDEAADQAYPRAVEDPANDHARAHADSQLPPDGGADAPRQPVAIPEEALDAERDIRRSYLDGWLFGSIQWLLARRRRQAGDVRTEATPGIERRSLYEVLDGFQARVPDQESFSPPSIDALKQALVEEVAASGRSQHRELSVVDENVLDSVGMMFDFMGRDSNLPEPFQAALGKLQIPYLKAALRDPAMLAGGDAPAKLLLNELADAGLGWNRDSDSGGKMLDKVGGIVDRVLSDYRDDPSVFTEMLDEFRGFQERRSRRAEVVARRESEAMAGRERLQLARTEVGRFMVEQTEGVQLPDLVGELLRKSWAHVMVLTMLEHGRESEQWQQAEAVARELIWSVTFEPKHAEVTRLKTRLPALARALAVGLRKVGYGDAEIRKLQYKLKQLYVDLMRRSGSDRVVIEASSEGLVIRGEDLTELGDDDALELVEDDAELGAVLDSVRAWRSGQWVMFHRGEGDPLRCKLSWVSPITGRYLFVNQRGVKVEERTPAELAEDLIGERLQPLDAEELISRAMGAVAEELREAAA